jgi:hypothetical protein
MGDLLDNRWCEEGDLNPHDFLSRQILSLLCIPISPPSRGVWRLRPELNRRPRICSPLHNHSATQPRMVCSILRNLLAGNETRTRDPNLGKVVLYQLSYSRLDVLILPLLFYYLQYFFYLFYILF